MLVHLFGLMKSQPFYQMWNIFAYRNCRLRKSMLPDAVDFCDGSIRMATIASCAVGRISVALKMAPSSFRSLDDGVFHEWY